MTATHDAAADPFREALEQVHAALERGEPAVAAEATADLHPAELADLLASLPVPEREALWHALAPHRQDEVLAYLDDAVRAPLAEELGSKRLAEAAEELDADDAADLLQDLPDEMVDEVLQAMDAANRQRIAEVLSWPEDTAGGLMNTDAVAVRADVTVAVVERYLRRLGELPERTDALFVVDREGRYIGALPLARVLTAPLQASVGEVMADEPAAIPALTPAAEVAQLFERRDLLSAPVVDDDGALIGRITVDDVLDLVREMGEHQLMGLAGMSEEEDVFAPPLDSARRRAVWLGINLATAFAAAWVVGRFEDTIAQLVALAVLMPVVASMGGIAGSQTLAIVIRALALGQVSDANARHLLVRELVVAALNAMLWSLVVAAIALAWFGDPGLAAVFGLALLANIVIGALSGVLVPVTLQRLGIDPAVAGGVILTTVTDMAGFFVFLGSASVLLLGRA